MQRSGFTGDRNWPNRNMDGEGETERMTHWVETEYTDIKGVAVVWINREKSLNALNRDVLMALDDAFRQLENQNENRVVVVSGRGERAFIAGADIEAIHAVKTGEEGRALAELGQRVFQRIAESRLISIAAINGYALGGGLELAMALDLRIAAEEARLGQPEINLGVIPGFGGTQRLPRLVGEGRALWMILSGEAIDARTALSYGLVDAVVPRTDLMQESLRRAGILSSKAPLALCGAKSLVRATNDLPLSHALEWEAERFGRLAVSRDGKEGTEAFLAKRSPQFLGE